MFAPKSVGRMAIKAYFAFIRHSETSRGARRWRLDTIRNAKGARLVVKRKDFTERRTLLLSK